MEKVFGPFSGYLAIVSVSESEDGTKFAASYSICRSSSGEDSDGRVLQKSVGGHSASIDEATEIALQLARLQISGLTARGTSCATTRGERASTLTAFRTSWGADPQCSPTSQAYQPTMPCPLLPISSGPA